MKESPRRLHVFLESLKNIPELENLAKHNDWWIEFSEKWPHGEKVFVRSKLWEKLSPHLIERVEPAFDADMYTESTLKEMTAEFIREQCFENLRAEVPYSIAVLIHKYQESPKMDRIEADIVVSRESHKGIVIGRGGAMLKRIGSASRNQIEKMAQKKVFLGLNVVVKEGWDSDKLKLKEYGYVRE